MLRIAVLGAAAITKDALLTPAREVSGVQVVAIAARDRDRAAAYAQRHGIPRVLRDYDAVLADELIDAVYIPLPAALHGRWASAAIAAGKHVLLEKPFTANGDEAAELAAETAGSEQVLMEAYHTGFHPLAARLRELVGTLGPIVSARAEFCVPIPPGDDIRWNRELAGGGLLDVGYYPVRVLRDLLGGEPTVVTATARERNGVDALMEARLDIGGVQAEVVSSIWSRRLLSASLEVRGENGRLRVTQPYHAHPATRVRVDGPVGRLRERPDPRSTYAFQLEAFRDATEGGPVINGAPEAVGQMRTLDAIYRAAGMEVRQPIR